jgi:hypothetical protein
MNTKKTGSILISVVVLLTLATLLSIFAFIYTGQSLLLKRDEIIFAKHEDEQILATFEAMQNNLALPYSYLNCFSEKSKLCLQSNENFNSISVEPEITEVLLEKKDFFPQFNFNDVFLNTSPCFDMSNHSGNSTVSGDSLSNASSVWDKTCTIKNDETFEDAAFLSNFESLYAASIRGIYFSSTGYIKLASTLKIESDISIIAGGDVIIEKLISDLPYNVNIISTTGLITIRGIEGNLNLRLISRYGNFISVAYSKQGTLSLPFLLPLNPIMLSR